MSVLTQVSTSIARRLVTKRNIERAFGKDTKLERAFYICQQTKAKTEIYYAGEFPVFSISSPAGVMAFHVNTKKLNYRQR